MFFPTVSHLNPDAVLGSTTLQPSSQLPAIPSQVLERIRRGEFVNFDFLLPNNVLLQTHNTYTMSLDGLENHDGAQIVVRNNMEASRNRVRDLDSWLLA